MKSKWLVVAFMLVNPCLFPEFPRILEFPLGKTSSKGFDEDIL